MFLIQIWSLEDFTPVNCVVVFMNRHLKLLIKLINKITYRYSKRTFLTVASQYFTSKLSVGLLNDGLSKWIDFVPFALNLILSSWVGMMSRSPYPQNIFIVSWVKGTSRGSHVSRARLNTITVCVKFWYPSLSIM